jgi:hypothetical protein
MQGAASPKKIYAANSTSSTYVPVACFPPSVFFSRRRRDRGASASVSNFCFDRWCPVLQAHGFHMCLLCGGEHDKVFLPCMEAACRIAFHAAQIRADYLTSSALGSFRFQVWIACVAPER